MKRISEDWDGDLLKIVPQAGEIIAPVADVRLFTRGSADEHGRLSHPSVWNHYMGMVAFFDFEGELESKPEFFSTDKPIARCTALEALCDAWEHHYVLFIRQAPVWDTFALRNLMMNLLMDARARAGGRTPLMSDGDREEALNIVAEGLRCAGRRIEDLRATTVE